MVRSPRLRCRVVAPRAPPLRPSAQVLGWRLTRRPTTSRTGGSEISLTRAHRVARTQLARVIAFLSAMPARSKRSRGQADRRAREASEADLAAAHCSNYKPHNEAISYSGLLIVHYKPRQLIVAEIRMHS